MTQSTTTTQACAICGGIAKYIGSRAGNLDGRRFDYFQCPACLFSFVGNPRTDYAEIYSEAYYRGQGADPLVDYVDELENPKRTIRDYEWQGLLSIFRELMPAGGRWLDFGCGAGGLVRNARLAGFNAIGFEEGWGANAARSKKIPVVDAVGLDACAGGIDFVTAIEVVEHVHDPVSVLKQMRRLLRPGGILFLTTGNAEPWRGRLFEWSYASIPEVHISFYEPRTLEVALKMAGFRVEKGRFFSGYTGVVKYKMLKSLKIKRKHWYIDWLPWQMLTRMVDMKYRTSAQPYGIAE
jgi:SAM-dependent methyltransferase